MDFQGYFSRKSFVPALIIVLLCLSQLVSCSGGGGASDPQPARNWINQS